MILFEVLALLSYPPLLEFDMFPADAKHRAQEILASCRGIVKWSVIVSSIKSNVLVKYYDEKNVLISIHQELF